MGVSTDPGPPGGPFVLTLSCPDRPRIVNEVTGFLVKHSGNIRESQQFGDPDTEHFFMRIMFDLADHSVDANTLRADFAAVAEAFDMTFQLWAAHAPHRTLILVSKHLHCLNDLLFRWGTGALQIEIPAIVSNHKDAARLAATYNVPFHHVPVTPEDKPAAEAKLLELVDEHRIDLVVLARYMQVLSDPTCRALEGRAINIHHSFLPSFKGARPYQQAFEHGVKLVGATAHYVTGDLDEGPIIEQDTLRVDHSYSERQLVTAGRDVEAQVLSRAVRWHAESRVLMNGSRTVVFR